MRHLGRLPHLLTPIPIPCYACLTPFVLCPTELQGGRRGGAPPGAAAPPALTEPGALRRDRHRHPAPGRQLGENYQRAQYISATLISPQSGALRRDQRRHPAPGRELGELRACDLQRKTLALQCSCLGMLGQQQAVAGASFLAMVSCCGRDAVSASRAADCHLLLRLYNPSVPIACIMSRAPTTSWYVPPFNSAARLRSQALMSLALYETEVGPVAAARLQAVLPCLQVLPAPQLCPAVCAEPREHGRCFCNRAICLHHSCLM